MPEKKDVDAWDLEYAHLEWGAGSDLSWIRKEIPAGGKILDAGSGTGRYLKELFRTYPCVALDFSKQALLKSRERMEPVKDLSRRKNAGVKISDPIFVTASVTHLPFLASFDVVLCLGVLQHLQKADREKSVFEFFRVLRPNGCVFFEAFGCDDMRFGTEKQEADTSPEPNSFVRKNGILYHYFDENEVQELFEKNGFKIREIRSVKKEKKYDGNVFVRHHIRGIFEKE
ncbi:class I SAM-dependent methyltransferase [Methanolapillus ohkumae]|uniref:Methyltransferase type 11 domain-containing protein n=1 Tax=Methanolapillus ohkumae TaxID=3028298 RepID=A0AA96ZWX9_9EURY|nr:hypothetical protein MsAm2_01990 [Methanosarcinaceae archaeon Am2]